jgi:hypothetical protein
MTQLAAWNTAVRKRRAAILRLLAKIKKASGSTRVKRTANLANAIHYGVMNRHRHHWHKINGQWYLNIVTTKRLRPSSSRLK